MIAEYAPTMCPCKVMIVDGLLVSVGSTNFEADLGRSRPVSYAQWLERPWRERFGEKLASWVGSQR